MKLDKNLLRDNKLLITKCIITHATSTADVGIQHSLCMPRNGGKVGKRTSDKVSNQVQVLH